MKKDIDLIIFDLDGTLVDSRQDIVNAVNFMLDKLGLAEKSMDEIVSYVGYGITGLINKSLYPREAELQEKALGFFRNYYKAHSADYTYLYPGVKKILDHFKKKKMAVITNRNHKSSLNILEKMGICKYFLDVIGDDNTSCLKPSKCQFDRLMKKTSVKDSKRAIMIGDMDVDAIAGRAAGVLTCVNTYGFGKREDIEKVRPDYVIDDISELKSIII